MKIDLSGERRNIIRGRLCGKSTPGRGVLKALPVTILLQLTVFAPALVNPVQFRECELRQSYFDAVGFNSRISRV